MTPRPEHLDTYTNITHTLSELAAHGDAKQPKYQQPVPGSGKVSYPCKHNDCRHCPMLSCTCPCHASEASYPLPVNALK